MPRARAEVDASSQYLGADQSFDISEIGGEPDIEVVDRIQIGDKIKHEKFMAELVTVVIHDTNDKNASPIVQLGVNGRTQIMIRGKPQNIKRCYLERLARAKQTSFAQDMDRMDEAMNMVHSHHALSYPFSVVEDKNPKGAAWLRNILAEPA